MRNFLFIGTFLLLLTSCQPDAVLPTDTYPTGLGSMTAVDSGPTVSMWGRFKLISGVMYVDNRETNERLVFNHFNSTKHVSSLRWGGSLFDIENIEENVTTYSFYQPMSYPGYGKFVLNDDPTKRYAVYFVGSNKTIVEDPIYTGNVLMGGSSRPFSGQTVDYANGIIRIQIQEMEGSINGYNCHYWSELTFQKVASW
jgi:hypothetical protein